MLELLKGFSKMILDARLATSCRNARPYTSKAAVSNMLDKLEVGASVDVDAFFAPDGRYVERATLAAMVSTLKGERVFHVGTRYSSAGLATIRRLA